MRASPDGMATPACIYQLGDRRIEPECHDFAEAVETAHALRQRPRCLCTAKGVEMYIARLGDTFIIKRMPNSGRHHSHDCPSYEPPSELSGLGQVLGSAITEDVATGTITLKLDFPLSKIAGRSSTPTAGSVSTSGTKLSLRGLLHYLWDQAELTRWCPGFAGKRSWATVRKRLLLAAQDKITRGVALPARLYIPEVFATDQREAINARRLAQWMNAVTLPGKPQELMLLVAELKEIVPARYGYKAVVKHVPDQAFSLDEQLYRRLSRRFERELSLWSISEAMHMVIAATFLVNEAGVPTFAELTLMPVTDQWLPVEDAFERHLLERLIGDRRSFVKGLRYNMLANDCLASVILTDTANTPCALWIASRGTDGDSGYLGDQKLRRVDGEPVWLWRTADGPMPSLPPGGSDHSSPVGH